MIETMNGLTKATAVESYYRCASCLSLKRGDPKVFNTSENKSFGLS